MEIRLLNYGSNLGSRLLGRKIVIELKSQFDIADKIILDFQGVKFISFSFITELIHNLQEEGKDITFKGNSTFIAKQIEFALSSKSKNPVLPH